MLFSISICLWLLERAAGDLAFIWLLLAVAWLGRQYVVLHLALHERLHAVVVVMTWNLHSADLYILRLHGSNIGNHRYQSPPLPNFDFEERVDPL